MTPQQIVDVLHALQAHDSMIFGSVEEIERFGGPVAVAQTRYAELRLEMPSPEARAIAQAEMIATMLGEDTAGIQEEVRQRFEFQTLSFEQDLIERKRSSETSWKE